MHHWFNGVVSSVWWNHLWMNDGIATFFGLYITNKVSSHASYMLSMCPTQIDIVTILKTCSRSHKISNDHVALITLKIYHGTCSYEAVRKIFSYNKEVQGVQRGVTVFDSVQRGVTVSVIFHIIITVRSYTYVCPQFSEHLRVIDRFVVEDQQQLLSEDIAFHVNPVMHDIVTPKEIHTLFSGVMQKKGET